MTSARHSMVPGQRPAGVCTHLRAPDDLGFNLNHTMSTATFRAPYGVRPGIVQCLKSTRNKSLNKSADGRHRQMFYTEEHIAST